MSVMIFLLLPYALILIYFAFAIRRAARVSREAMEARLKFLEQQRDAALRRLMEK